MAESTSAITKSCTSTVDSCSNNTLIIASMAEAWASIDPNPVTAAYVQQLLLTAAPATEGAAPISDADSDLFETVGESVAATTLAAQVALQKLFPANPHERISFGTAGLRAAMKPGPLGMNDLVVVQTAQGLVRYCEEHFGKDANTKLGVVIGYDHRANAEFQLSSLSFALWSTLVFLEAGWDCLLLDGLVATPLVPFSLLQWQKEQKEQEQSTPRTRPVIGIMITASHNPKQDAGYKVYWQDACQIRSPIDAGIAAAIRQNLQPWVDYRAKLQDRRQQQIQSNNNDPCFGLSQPTETQRLIAAYFTALEHSGLVTGQGRLSLNANQDNNTAVTFRAPKFCYTAMHGVGHRFAVQSFATFGLPPFVSVPLQQEPDPEFPSVIFPNPEEHGALDLAQAFAQQHDCDVILANDPDADRLAVAERKRGTNCTSDEWIVFTGDQIGSMLGLWLWEQLGRKDDSKRPVVMCASAVSSQLLATIAATEGFTFRDALTGFKWIGSTAAHLHHNEGYRCLFCYEEAIGFCCGNVVFDKDGISAMSVFAELTTWVYQQQGLTLQQHLQQNIYDKYGEFVSHNGYYFLPNPAVALPIMEHMRTLLLGGTTTPTAADNDTLPPAVLNSVGPYAVASIRYLGEPPYDSLTSDHLPTLPTSASSPMMTIRFVNGCVAHFRASGTEPKFKYYIELPGKPGVARSQVEDDLRTMCTCILEILLQPAIYGLVDPSAAAVAASSK